MRALFSLWIAVCISISAHAEEFLPGVKRILFLGDSITQAGQYVADFDAFVTAEFPQREFVIINCGLSSETVSGLSETGHAGGKFPRPDLHERLDRVLALVKPDLVFACYGMNCGIYLPYDEVRSAKYKGGIRWLRDKVAAAGAQIIHITPPVFDAMPIKAHLHPADKVKEGQQFEGYDGVLGRYADWLVEQGRSDGWRVVDLHSTMAAAIAVKRGGEPAFTFAKDGIHPDDAGHLLMAKAIIHGLLPEKDADFAKLFAPESLAKDKAYFDSVRKRERVLAESYLSTAGHLRPGVGKGLPVAEAEAQAAELTKTIREIAPKL